MSLDTDAGRVVVTRIQTRRGANRMEIRAVVDLPDELGHARAVAAQLVEQVCRSTVVPARPAAGS